MSAVKRGLLFLAVLALASAARAGQAKKDAGKADVRGKGSRGADPGRPGEEVAALCGGKFPNLPPQGLLRPRHLGDADVAEAEVGGGVVALDADGPLLVAVALARIVVGGAVVRPVHLL